MSPELDDYAVKKGIAYWNCKLSFYGAAKANAANWAFAKEKFSEIPGAKFEDGENYKLPLTPEQQEKVHKPQFGIPSLAMFSIGARSAMNPEPANGHMWFSPIIPRTGEAIFEANRVFAAGREGIRAAVPQLQPALDVLGARVHLHFRFSGDARRRNEQEKSRVVQETDSRSRPITAGENIALRRRFRTRSWTRTRSTTTRCCVFTKRSRTPLTPTEFFPPGDTASGQSTSREAKS